MPGRIKAQLARHSRAQAGIWQGRPELARLGQGISSRPGQHRSPGWAGDAPPAGPAYSSPGWAGASSARCGPVYSSPRLDWATPRPPVPGPPSPGPLLPLSGRLCQAGAPPPGTPAPSAASSQAGTPAPSPLSRGCSSLAGSLLGRDSSDASISSTQLRPQRHASTGWTNPGGIGLAGILVPASTSFVQYRSLGRPWLRLVHVVVSLILRRRIRLMTRRPMDNS
jgi:hypothetical protein